MGWFKRTMDDSDLLWSAFNKGFRQGEDQTKELILMVLQDEENFDELKKKIEDKMGPSL
jgi:hypothetical protein